MGQVSQDFVRFFSPGPFFAETSDRPINGWDIDAACAMASEIKERYGATPYGFMFITRSRGPDDLDSREVGRSQTYFLGGKVRTMAEVEADNLPAEAILRSNMRSNGYDRIIVNDNSWRWTQPLRADDVVLDWPRA